MAGSTTTKRRPGSSSGLAAGVGTFSLIGATNPIQVTRTAGAITTAVSAVWVDTDTGGTAAARPLDIVIPNMATGDAFDFRLFISASSVTGATLMNLAVVVAGATQRRCFDETFGYLPWSIATGVAKDVFTATPRLTVLAGDIENGALRLRLQHIQASNARNIGGSSSVPIWMEGRGPLD